MSKLSTTTIKYVSLTDSTKLEDYINKVCIDAEKLKDRIQVASILDFSEDNSVAMLNHIKGQKSSANQDMGIPEDIQVA